MNDIIIEDVKQRFDNKDKHISFNTKEKLSEKVIYVIVYC